MEEPTPPKPESREPKPTPEEIARARMNRPYPRRFYTSEQVFASLRALEAEKARNPAFGPNDVEQFLERFDAAQPTHYHLADGTVVTFMPGEPS